MLNKNTDDSWGIQPVLHNSLLVYVTFQHSSMGVRGGAVGWCTALQAWWVRFQIMSLEFIIDVILLAALWSSASNRNDYQEYFLDGKGGRCVILTTLPPSWADCLEIWEPQPPGTLRVCPGLYIDWFIFAFILMGQKHFSHVYLCVEMRYF